MAKRSMFVGMDVHKESIDVSLAEEGRDGEVRHYGVIPGDLEAVAKVVRALRAPNRRCGSCTKPGRAGLGSTAISLRQGEDCVVVNPSSMPKRSGDRIKTDRRDGDALGPVASRRRAHGDLHPNADDEALRDLVRAREDAVGLSTQAKHRLKAFLLRQGRRYPGRAGWTRPYRRWLADLSFPARPAAHRAAGVPRHDRRDRTPCRTAHRSAPAAHADVALGAGGGRAAGVARRLVRHRGGPRHRGRRHSTLRLIRASSWRTSASCRRNTRADRVSDAAGSPRRAIRTPGACSPKRRGRIRACPASAARCSIAKKRCHRPCERLRGRPNSD